MIDTSTDSDRSANGSIAADTHSPALLSMIVGSPSFPVCTIYPPDVAAPYRSTRWLRARSDAFVDPEEWR